MIGGADGVSGHGVLQANEPDDLTRADLFKSLAILGVHFVDARDVFLLVVARIEYPRTSCQQARVDAHVGQVAVRVVDHLEDQGGERVVLGVATNDLGVGVPGVAALDVGDLGGVREVVDDGIEESLDSDVLQGRAAEYGVALLGKAALADRGLDVRHGDRVRILDVLFGIAT